MTSLSCFVSSPFFFHVERARQTPYYALIGVNYVDRVLRWLRHLDVGVHQGMVPKMLAARRRGHSRTTLHDDDRTMCSKTIHLQVVCLRKHFFFSLGQTAFFTFFGHSSLFLCSVFELKITKVQKKKFAQTL